MNYSVSSSSPTDELLTLGQIFSEVGDYASTILDREHLSLTRRCVTRLNKVVDELISRQTILSAENLYDMPEGAPTATDLKSLSISDLHSLYRRWPLRHNERRVEGRESMSFYYEGRIVAEMNCRKAANKGEQLKIDYCTTMYSYELSNMSYLFSRPVQIEKDKIYPDRNKVYSPEELTALICLYKDYRDIMEREILVEYVDLALDLLEKEGNSPSCLGLLAELAELGRKGIVRIPSLINENLSAAVNSSLASKIDNVIDLPLAMLTLHIINKDSALERKAQRIINRCYKAAFDNECDLSKRIDNLHTAVTCSDYVTRFSVRKSADLWKEFSVMAISTESGLTARHLFQLIEIAKECVDHVNISPETKDKLRQMLTNMANFDNLVAQAYSKILQH